MLDYSALKTAVQSESQRSGPIPPDVMRRITDEATQRINRRLGLALAPLIGDNDTNAILQSHDVIYLHACLEAYSRWKRDWEDALYYDERWITAIDDYEVNSTAETENNAAGDVDDNYIRSECELAVESA